MEVIPAVLKSLLCLLIRCVVFSQTINTLSFGSSDFSKTEGPFTAKTPGASISFREWEPYVH